MKILNKIPYQNVIDFIDVAVDLINNRKILSAVNLVIQDVYDSGIRTKKYLKKGSNDNFNILISLLAST